MSEPIRVLVVDDSAVVREAMKMILSPAAGFAVEVAADPIIAMAKMERTRPDVMVLDLEMPRMDGDSFLQKLMNEHPLPVLICTGITGRDSERGLGLLAAGAVGLITKPRLGLKDFLQETEAELLEAVRGAAQAKVTRHAPAIRLPPLPARRARVAVPGGPERGALIAIGASLGGTEALLTVLKDLPQTMPGIVIAQHMPEGYTAAFARRLNGLCALEVVEASDGLAVEPGRAIIAAGDRHLVVERSSTGYRVRVVNSPRVSLHRPSVDVLFRSVAEAAGPRAVGVLLTGMGDDGARGLLELRQAGAATLAQDEATCVVFGMPKEALARGAVEALHPLTEIGPALQLRTLASPRRPQPTTQPG